MILLLILYLDILFNSLNMLVIAGIIIIFGYKFKNMHKKAIIFYIIALIVTTLSLVFYDSGYVTYITNGLTIINITNKADSLYN